MPNRYYVCRIGFPADVEWQVCLGSRGIITFAYEHWREADVFAEWLNEYYEAAE